MKIQQKITFTFFFIIILQWGTHPIAAQDYPVLDIPVSVDGQELNHPWAGGMDAPQFSAADIDNDGNQDIFVFDRIGNVVMAFIWEDGQYIFNSEYVKNFPQLKNFALLRDFDGDGIEDIFAHGKTDQPVDGIVVFKGKIENDQVVYERFHFYNPPADVISYPFNNDLFINVYVSSIDVPDINDIDNDGDLDILSFDVIGSHLTYFQNQSVEQGYGTDSLIFIREDECWGKFYESSMSEEVELSDDPDQCSNGLIGDPIASPRHAGSTSTSVDIDGDNDRDLLIGDIINPNQYLLVNGGTSEQAHITSQDNDFPSYNTPVLLPDFNASYILDVNQDGLKDLIASPNSTNSPNIEAAWYYENTGENPNGLTLNLYNKSFLIDQMIDLGSGAHPVFVDVNADQILDLVVGNEGINIEGGNREARLALFINEGTVQAPRFVLEDDDWLNASELETNLGMSTWAYSPAFGDMDSDGDLDLFVGEFNGSLFYAENTAGPDQALEFSAFEILYQNIDVGLNSSPFVIDLNQDGLLDLVIGERNGNLNFLPNQGTASTPIFHPEENEAPNDNTLGNVILANSIGIGHTTPFFFESNGQPMLAVGSNDQGVKLYEYNPNDLEAEFIEVTGNLEGLKFGIRTHPALGQIIENPENNALEMIVGNFRGGMQAFGTPLNITSINNHNANAVKILITASPNPTDHSFIIEIRSDQLPLNQDIPLTVCDALGRIMHFETVFPNTRVSIASQNWTAGMYFIQVGTQSIKIVKK